MEVNKERVGGSGLLFFGCPGFTIEGSVVEGDVDNAIGVSIGADLELGSEMDVEESKGSFGSFHAWDEYEGVWVEGDGECC